MTTAAVAFPAEREPELHKQTVVVIGGSAGIGLDVARRTRAEGADVILTGRDPERPQPLPASRQTDERATMPGVIAGVPVSTLNERRDDPAHSTPQ